MDQNPNSREHQGRYNVPEDSSAYCDPEIETRDLLPITFDELDGVTVAFAEYRDSLKSEKQIGSGFHLDFNDRTVFWEFRDIRGYAFEHLKQLQSVLVDHDRWRIYVQGHSPEASIFVYKNSIEFPQRNVSEGEQLTTIRESNSVARDTTFGVHDRQFALVEKVISKAQLPSRPFLPQVIAAFNSYKGNRDRFAIWCVFDGYPHEERHWFPDESSDGRIGRASKEFDVTQAGELTAFMSSGISFAGLLKCYVYDAKQFAGQVEVVSPHNGERTWIPVDRVLDDNETRTRLSAQQS